MSFFVINVTFVFHSVLSWLVRKLPREIDSFQVIIFTEMLKMQTGRTDYLRKTNKYTTLHMSSYLHHRCFVTKGEHLNINWTSYRATHCSWPQATIGSNTLLLQDLSGGSNHDSKMKYFSRDLDESLWRTARRFVCYFNL